MEAIRPSRKSCPDIWAPRAWPTSARRATSSRIAPTRSLGLAKANIDQLADAILEAGLMDAAELERYRAILARPDCFYPASMALISVWGRRQLA